MREWENQKTDFDDAISRSYGNIEWTKIRAAALHDLYHAAPLGKILHNYSHSISIIFILNCSLLKLGFSEDLLVLLANGRSAIQYRKD